MTNQTPPMFVVLTGLDGPGTTAVGRLAASLWPRSQFVECPLRQLSLAQKQFEASRPPAAARYLYYLAGNMVMSSTVERKLQLGFSVFCVNYLIDTVVSARVLGIEVDLQYETEFCGIRRPDLTVFLNIDEELRQKRLSKRGKDTWDLRVDDREFRDSIVKEYLRFSNEFVAIDNSAGPPFVAAEAIVNRLRGLASQNMLDLESEEPSPASRSRTASYQATNESGREL